MTDTPRPTIRVDKWLYYARFFKTRGLAAKCVTAGHLRVNSARILKASHAVGPQDVLTFPQGRRVRVARILAVGTRRGPASEAQALYEDLSPPPPPRQEIGQGPSRTPGTGRPTKRERRNMRLSRDLPLE